MKLEDQINQRTENMDRRSFLRTLGGLALGTAVGTGVFDKQNAQAATPPPNQSTASQLYRAEQTQGEIYNFSGLATNTLDSTQVIGGASVTLTSDKGHTYGPYTTRPDGTFTSSIDTDNGGIPIPPFFRRAVMPGSWDARD